MKKKYVPPSLVINTIVPTDMIAASMPLRRGGQDEYEIVEESVLLSRCQNSIWDDDDE